MECVVIATASVCVSVCVLLKYYSCPLYYHVCLASISWAEWAETKLTAVQASVWNSLAWRCEVIGSQISSVEGIVSSLSNWFPLWVDDSIWTPAFPIRCRVTVCSITSSPLLASLFRSNFLFYLIHRWSNFVHPWIYSSPTFDLSVKRDQRCVRTLRAVYARHIQLSS